MGGGALLGSFGVVVPPGSLNPETSIRYDQNQDPAVFKVTKINYNEKTAKKKRLARRFFFAVFSL